MSWAKHFDNYADRCLNGLLLAMVLPFMLFGLVFMAPFWVIGWAFERWTE